MQNYESWCCGLLVQAILLLRKCVLSPWAQISDSRVLSRNKKSNRMLVSCLFLLLILIHCLFKHVSILSACLLASMEPSLPSYSMYPLACFSLSLSLNPETLTVCRELRILWILHGGIDHNTVQSSNRQWLMTQIVPSSGVILKPYLKVRVLLHARLGHKLTYGSYTSYY